SGDGFLFAGLPFNLGSHNTSKSFQLGSTYEPGINRSLYAEKSCLHITGSVGHHHWLHHSLRNYTRGIAVILAITSLVQFLFFVPQIGGNKYAGFAIVAICGGYRTSLEVFSHYFF